MNHIDQLETAESDKSAVVESETHHCEQWKSSLRRRVCTSGLVDSKANCGAARWYVLGAVCSALTLNSLIYNSWAPIASSAQAVFQWSDSVLYVLNGASCLTFIIASLPAAALIKRFGACNY